MSFEIVDLQDTRDLYFIFCFICRDELQQLLEEEDTDDSNENKFVEEYRQLMSENVSASVWHVPDLWQREASVESPFCLVSDVSFPPTEMDSDSDPRDGDPSLKWIQ